MMIRDWTVIQHHPDGHETLRYSFDTQAEAERICDALNEERDSTDLAFFVVANTTGPMNIIGDNTFNEPPC